ncbi:MAG: hypothetical protein ABI565_05535, partial [Vicinamibacteria bacterium]
MIKIDLRTLDDLLAFLRAHEPDWSRINLLGLDLRAVDIDDALLKQEFDARTAFLGCLMSPALARKAVAAGALVVPGRPGLPFNAFRSELYRAADLLKGYARRDPGTYLKTPDWQCYLAAMDKDSKRKRVDQSIDEAVFFRLHDLAIEDALDAYLKPRHNAGAAPKRV